MQFQSLTVPKEANGKRLDQFLTESLDLSRNALQNMIKEGHVRLNHNEPKKAGVKLEEDDLIHYRIVKEDSPLKAEEMDLNILFEDDELLVINKAPGIVVHPDETGHRDGTIANAVLAHCKQLSGEAHRPGIVHRLDKDTSGCLLIAKTDSMRSKLNQLFQDRKIHKKYWALVKGSPKTEEGSIEAAIKRDTKHRKRMAIHPQGKMAITHFKVLENFKDCSLIEVVIETGRTHQIRLHMASIGHPVIGDELYGEKKVNKAFESKYDLHRQFLHAKEIAFEGRQFEAPLSTDLKKTLDQME